MSITINNLLVNDVYVRDLAINQQLTNVPYNVYLDFFINLSPDVDTSVFTQKTGQELLTYNNLPEILYIGANYCPYCAATRWALLLALAKLGTWSNIVPIFSSPTDSFPNTATYSFAGMNYVSNYISFVEIEAFDVNGAPLQYLSTSEEDIYNTFNPPGGGFPFVSLGNQVIQSGSTFSPELLAGLSHADIAAGLNDPTNRVTAAIVSTADIYLIYILESLTNYVPENLYNFVGIPPPPTLSLKEKLNQTDKKNLKRVSKTQKPLTQTS
jgi:hypothetical protein